MNFIAVFSNVSFSLSSIADLNESSSRITFEVIDSTLVTVGVCEGVSEGRLVGDTDTVGETDGDLVGLVDGNADGLKDGVEDGDFVGETDGPLDGLSEGLDVGMLEGD